MTRWVQRYSTGTGKVAMIRVELGLQTASPKPHLCAMTNSDRMLQLADEVFAMPDNPTQLQVDEAELERLHRLRPATRGEGMDPTGML